MGFVQEWPHGGSKWVHIPELYPLLHVATGPFQAVAICDRHGRTDLKCYYNPLTGFDSLAEDKDTASLRLPLKLWNCAESIKCSLAVNDTATEFVEFPGGAIESITFTREEFLSLALHGYRRICETTANAVAEHGPVDHILLVGGSSLLVGLRNELADSLSIAADEIHLKADSRTLIANRACQMAMSGVVDETDQVVSRGIAVRVEVRREG